MILLSTGVILALIFIWFSVPFSPLKAAFNRQNEQLKKASPLYSGEVFTKEDFSNFPPAVQKYIASCGYIGTPKMNFVKMLYRNVKFSQQVNGAKLKIDYTQYNYAKQPARLALIQSRLFGIPFEGYDYYSGGAGGMKGVIAKCFTLFNQTGSSMDKACLVTYLAESLFLPSALLQNRIQFEEISDFEVKATIFYNGQSAGGIFTFNNEYEMISFTTNDRAVIGTDGKAEYIPWTAACGGYKTNELGIKQPTVFKAIWNYPEKDFVYFDGTISRIEYE